MSRISIFVNPIAGRGRARDIAARIANRFARDQFEVRIFDQPAHTISDAELSVPSTAAIVIGGDGTLRTAVERLMAHARGDESHLPPIVVVPLGTANLMARHFGINWSEPKMEEHVFAAVKNRRLAMLDAAKANDRLFLLMVGIGIDAAIIHEMDRIRSGPIDYLSYAMPALLSLGKYNYPPLSVSVDGRRIFHDTPAMAFVGNVPEYGTGFPILTQARPDDGQLDVCVVPCRSPQEAFRLLLTTATGDHINQEGVIYTKGKSVRIESSVTAPVQIDGEALGNTPVAIDLLPSRVPFIVP